MKKTRISILILLCLCAPLGAQERTVLTLDECKSLALEHNNTLRNANLDKIAAKAKKDEVFTNWFPTVQMTGIAFHSFDYKLKMTVADVFGHNDFAYNMQALWNEAYPELGASQTFNFLKYGQYYGAVAIQPIFAGGRIVNGNRYAALGIQAADLKSNIARRDVLEEVERDYFEITALAEKKKTLDVIETLLDSLTVIADIAYNQGTILKADHMLLETKRMELENGQLKLRSGMKLLKMNLLNYIGIKYSIFDIDKFEFPSATMDCVPAPEDVYTDEEEVAANLEESQLLQLQVEAMEYEKKLTLGETLPQLALGVNYGFTKMNEYNNGRWNGTTFAVLQIPLSDWGKNSFKMKRLQTEIDKAVNDRDYLREMLVLQQRKFYFDLTSAWDALQLANKQKEYSEYLYYQAKLSYTAGYSTVADLLRAYSNLAQKSEDWCNSLNDYLTALQIYKGRIKVAAD